MWSISPVHGLTVVVCIILSVPWIKGDLLKDKQDRYNTKDNGKWHGQLRIGIPPRLVRDASSRTPDEDEHASDHGQNAEGEEQHTHLPGVDLRFAG